MCHESVTERAVTKPAFSDRPAAFACVFYPVGSSAAMGVQPSPDRHGPALPSLHLAQPRREQRDAERGQNHAGGNPHQQAGELLVRETIDPAAGYRCRQVQFRQPCSVQVPHDSVTRRLRD